MDAERLLGGLLSMGIRQSVGRGLNTMGMGSKAALGLGALGVAMAAFEHFTSQNQTPPNIPSPAIPTPTGGASAPVPPPPPGVKTVSPPPPPSPGSPEQSQRKEEAVLLIRAMIAAANADGLIDDGERNRILDEFKKAGLSDEERDFVLQELLSPANLETIAASTPPNMAESVYAVSYLSTQADTAAEQTYLKTLAQRLALHETTVQQIHAHFQSVKQ